MELNSQEVTHIVNSYRLKAEKAKRKCFISDCKSTAIDSHILQENGILDQISEEGHLVEFIHSPFENNYIGFKKSGKNKAFKFKGFCEYHDNLIFQEIEKKDYDLTNYHHLILFCYRVQVNEIRKKQVLNDWFNMILDDSRMPVDLKDDIKLLLMGERKGIEDGYYSLKPFNHYFHNNQKKFLKFIVRDLSFQPICASGTYSFETSAEIAAREQKGMPFSHLTDVYFHLLPKNKRTFMVIGYPVTNNLCQEYFNSFKSRNEERLRVLISNILLFQIENWVTSLSYKNRVLDKYKDKFIELIMFGMNNPHERRIYPVDIFEKENL